MAHAELTATFNPADPAFIVDPFTPLSRLREEAPMYWCEALSSWVATSYDFVDRILGDSEYSAERLSPFYRRAAELERNQLQDVVGYLHHWSVFRDPPDHVRLRRLLSDAFTPMLSGALEASVAHVVRGLVDEMARQGTADLMRELAGPLPALVIMDLLGVPRERLADVRHWSDELVTFVGSSRNVPDKYERARQAVMAMADYFRDLLEQRRANLGEDLLSALTRVADENGPLTADEAVANAMLLMFAGNETTTSFIGNAMLALVEHPDAQAALRADPALQRTGVEELLRYDGPMLSTVRVVREAHELGGHELAVGDRIFAMIGAADRDPAAFRRPEFLDLARKPNRHLQFGRGIHHCLGAALARLEAGAALVELVTRFPRIDLVRPRQELGWVNAILMRGPLSVPLRLC